MHGRNFERGFTRWNIDLYADQGAGDRVRNQGRFYLLRQGRPEMSCGAGQLGRAGGPAVHLHAI